MENRVRDTKLLAWGDSKFGQASDNRVSPLTYKVSRWGRVLHPQGRSQQEEAMQISGSNWVWLSERH